MTGKSLNESLKKGWSYKKLNQLGFVGRGKSKHRPRNEPSLFGGNYPFIQTGEVKAADLYISKYSQTYNEKGLAQSKLWQANTLLITIAANIADTAILKFQACFPDSIVGFVANPKESDVRFVKYYIDTLKLQMQNISRGTTQDNLSLDKLLSFDFLVPEVSTQHKIASILSAYDDLIENNTRRIKILEEMAQMLYREWFVNFRFPNHENVRMVESELGLIPEGWDVVDLGSLTSVITKGTTPTTLKKGFVEEGINFIKIESISNNGSIIEQKLTKIDIETHNLLKRSQLQNNDILFSIAGAIGRTTLVYSKLLPANTNQALAIIRPKNIQLVLYLYQSISSQEFLDFSLGRVVQTAQANVSLSVLSSARILSPCQQTLDEYNSIISSFVKHIFTLRDKNSNLRKTRDLLLPKLISGEIDVEKLDIETLEMAA